MPDMTVLTLSLTFPEFFALSATLLLLWGGVVLFLDCDCRKCRERRARQ